MSLKCSVFLFWGFLILEIFTSSAKINAGEALSTTLQNKKIGWNAWDASIHDRSASANKLVFLLVEKERCPNCFHETEALNEERVKDHIESNYLPVRISKADRPEFALYYSQILQLLKGTVVWPFAVVLTPEGKPVWADSIANKEALLKTLKLVPDLWETPKGKTALNQKASDIETELARIGSQQSKKKNLDEETLQTFYNRALVQYDREYQGFDRKEKRPPSQILMTLMRIYRRTGAPPTKEMVLDTLKTMRYKNLHDQSEGGFYYGTSDGKWLSPYLEKSLLINSMLILTYVDASQLFDLPEFYNVANETIEYLRKNLIKSNPIRLIDSEKKIKNTEISFSRTSSVAVAFGIAALAKFARVNSTNTKDLELAVNIAKFVESELIKSGKLRHAIRDGVISDYGYSEGYAALIFGLTELYFSSADERWLKLAFELQESQNKLFWDQAAGGYFLSSYSPIDKVPLMKDSLDQDRPSTQSLSAFNLLRLADLTNKGAYRKMAIKIIELGGESFERFPLSYPFLCLALDYLTDTAKQLVLVGPKSSKGLPNEIRAMYLPNTVFAFKGPNKSEFPIADSKVPLNGAATYYICENKVCKFPTIDIKKVVHSLSAFSPYSYTK